MNCSLERSFSDRAEQIPGQVDELTLEVQANGGPDI